MINKFPKKHFFYTAFAVMFATTLLATSDQIVRSEPTVDATPSPFKFKRFPAPNWYLKARAL